MLGVAWVSGACQRIVPAVADNLELVWIELVFVHDRLPHSIRAIIGELPDEVGRDDALAAGVSISLDDDIGITESAGQLANFLDRRWNRRVVLRVEHIFVRL